ncbi:unnamed protein product [Rotaria socialis]|uniref:Uncharacterized protein n=2 Tax=Rotaria socialis TaxID=392032 RepID=A0A818YRR5_9BILA|nr:unnamed protein product [Rotaria socialis]
MSIYVDMGKFEATKTLIHTDSIATCHVLLLDGLYYVVPFAYMHHNSYAIATNGIANDLKSLLGSLMDKLCTSVGNIMKKPIKLKNFNDLRLFIFGGAIYEEDHEREAYSLLINPSASMYEHLATILDTNGINFYHKLVNRTVILKAITYEAPSASDEEDDAASKGLLVAQCECNGTDLDFAYMRFHMLSTKEDQYQWKLKEEEIQKTKDEIGTRRKELEALNTALSLMPARSLFISSSSSSSSSAISKLNNDNQYSPFGELLFSCKLKGQESSPFFISRVNHNHDSLNHSKFFDWDIRLTAFLVFCIDNVSIIDNNNMNLITYLIYQQYQNDNGQTRYASIGFTTLHLYYAYPDKKRARISHIIVLPPYQRKAENPTNGFIALRDLVLLELCHNLLPDLFSKKSIIKITRLTQEMINQARDQQTRRVHEICLLQSINGDDKEQMKQFRLIVKRRIFVSLQIKYFFQLR